MQLAPHIAQSTCSPALNSPTAWASLCGTKLLTPGKEARKNGTTTRYLMSGMKGSWSLVRRDRNHRSVFIWSIGNEVMDQRNVEMTKHLADIVRNEDPTRPVSNGYNDPDGSREVGSPQSLDIMGVNYFFGQQAKWDADPRYADMPTLGSETSSCVSSRGEYFFGTHLQNWQITSYDLAHPGWGCTPDQRLRMRSQLPPPVR